MASVDVMTADHITEIVNACVKTASLDSSGFLTLTLADGITTISVGQVVRAADLTALIASQITSMENPITNALVKSAVIDGSNHLILTLGDGVTTVDVGDVNPIPTPVNPGLSLTPGAGFAVTTFSARKVMGLASVSILLAYSGATVTASATGNITDTLAATLPTGLRPVADFFPVWDRSGTTFGGGIIQASNGNITLKTMNSGASLNSGDAVGLSATYICA